MLQLAIINKKRRLWARINFYIFITSILLVFLFIFYLEDFISEKYQRYPTAILVSIGFVTGIINNLPLKKHLEVGHIVFQESSIEFVIFEKVREIKITEIQQISYEIKGYYGEEYFDRRKLITVHDGTNNFFTLHFNGQKMKKEFFLDNKREMNAFNYYMQRYLTQLQ